MSSEKGLRRWNAVLVLVGLAALFYWIGRKPAPAPEEETVPVVTPGTIVREPPKKLPPDQEMALPKPVEPNPPPRVVEKPLLEFSLPTDNQSIFASQPEQFFMFVDRYTPAGQIQVWEGGSYGFVRNPRETAQGKVFTKFHEGIDIAPAVRDAKGEPQDQVRAIADGVVAYVTMSSRTSNYGNYVVMLHQIGTTGVFYSLYAHLKSTSAVAGQTVGRGSPLGMLGYTGSGIDRRRAHLHLEIGLVLSERFDQYNAKSKGLANPHGNYHGSNLIGLNAADFLAANHAEPLLMPDQFLRQQEVYYKVLVPNRGQELELGQRYPWLRQGGPAAASWEISFTGPGVPIAIAPSAQTASFATVSWVKSFGGYHSWNTRSMLGGSGNTATLTAEGNRMLTLTAGDF